MAVARGKAKSGAEKDVVGAEKDVAEAAKVEAEVGACRPRLKTRKKARKTIRKHEIQKAQEGERHRAKLNGSPALLHWR
jgi:hypothetical protein